MTSRSSSDALASAATLPDGLLVTVPSSREAWMLCRSIRSHDDRSSCNVFDAQYLAARDPSGAEVSDRWATTRVRCVAYGVTASELDRLEDAATSAPPVQSLLMMQLIELSMADAGFIVVLAKNAPQTHLPAAVVQLVGDVFDRRITRTRCSAGRSSTPMRLARRLGVRVGAPRAPSAESLPELARPSPARLDRSLDPDLLTATLGEGEIAMKAWRSWLARSSIDASAFELLQVGPMLYENLRRAGAHDRTVTGTVRGLHRRAWYDNQLRLRDAGDVLRGLREHDIDPLVLGDVVAAVASAEGGAVRPIRTIDLCVSAAEAVRVVALLEQHGWRPPQPVTNDIVKTATWTRLRAGSRRLDLHWRPLPGRASALSGVSRDDVRTQHVDGVTATTPSPTRQLLRLWARTADSHPGHQLRTICDTADVLARCATEIEWSRLWRDCGALDLVQYGERYLSILRSVSVVADVSFERMVSSGRRA